MYYDFYGNDSKSYKVYWVLAVTHSEDGYFKKKILDIHNGYKYTSDLWEAKKILEKVNEAIDYLGLAHLAKTGIEEE